LHLADNQTVELLYLQARPFEVESDIVFHLAALDPGRMVTTRQDIPF
jgi:hypothetical protein